MSEKEKKKKKKKTYFNFSLKTKHSLDIIIPTTFSRATDADHMCLRVITGSSINMGSGDSSITETNIPPT